MTTVKDGGFSRLNKNAPKIKDFNQVAYQYFGGVDFLSIEGVSHATVLGIMAEIGPEGFNKFDSSKKFTSWLRLAPYNKISGGKILRSKIPKGSNRLKIALRKAAVSATARKLVVIIWNMVTNKIPYQATKEYLFLDQKRKLGLSKRIRKQMDKFGLTIEDLGLNANHCKTVT